MEDMIGGRDGIDIMARASMHVYNDLSVARSAVPSGSPLFWNLVDAHRLISKCRQLMIPQEFKC